MPATAAVLSGGGCRPSGASMSRFASRSAMSLRRSWSCLPRARPSSIFARPRSLMYSRSGTIVWPFWRVRPTSSSISERWSSSLRVRLGRGCRAVSMPARTARCARRSATPRPARRARRHCRGSTLWARIDLISVPVRARPASKVSSIVIVVAGSSVEGDGLVAHARAPGRWWSLEGSAAAPGRTIVLRTHERRPRQGPASDCGFTTRRSDRLDGHLLRGGECAGVRHCTSPPFVRGYRTGERRGCKRGMRSSGGRHPPRGRARRSGRPGARTVDASRTSRPWRSVAGVIVRRRPRSTRRRARAPSVDPALVRRQPARDGQPEAPPFAGQLLPLLDGALAERRARRRAWRDRCPGARPPRSRGRRAAPIDEDHDLDRRGRSRRRRRRRRWLTWAPVASSSPEDRARSR